GERTPGEEPLDFTRIRAVDEKSHALLLIHPALDRRGDLQQGGPLDVRGRVRPAPEGAELAPGARYEQRRSQTGRPAGLEVGDRIADGPRPGRVAVQPGEQRSQHSRPRFPA